MEQDKKDRELERAALQILDASRKRLALDRPELLPCIYLLPAEAHEIPGPLWTDGETLFFHPRSVVDDYLARKTALCGQLLHVIVHGLLGHLTKRKGQAEPLFDAAADVKVTDFMARLGGGYTHPRSWPQETRSLMKTQTGVSLERLYQVSENTKEARQLVEYARPLKVDDHSFWGKPQSRRGQGGGAGRITGIWQAAIQAVAQGLERMGKGDLAGELSEVYRDVRESGVSYAEFLRRFMSVRERLEVDPDSIDRIWYHTGLELLGDTLIVEPEELKEDAPALQLAVALDTSGSCHGEIIKEFLGELLAILRDSGGPKVEITLIQCDAELQKVSVLTREDDAGAIAEEFQTYGYGGTDFCPVFKYLDRMREDAEGGKRFKGLLYLSDGFGEFPKTAPDYPTAFLFPRESDADFRRGWIPDWVTQVSITKDNRLIIIKGKEEELL